MNNEAGIKPASREHKSDGGGDQYKGCGGRIPRMKSWLYSLELVVNSRRQWNCKDDAAEDSLLGIQPPTRADSSRFQSIERMWHLEMQGTGILVLRMRRKSKCVGGTSVFFDFDTEYTEATDARTWRP